MRLEEGENFLKNAVGGIVSRCWALSCITEAYHLSCIFIVPGVICPRACPGC